MAHAPMRGWADYPVMNWPQQYLEPIGPTPSGFPLGQMGSAAISTAGFSVPGSQSKPPTPPPQGQSTPRPNYAEIDALMAKMRELQGQGSIYPGLQDANLEQMKALAGQPAVNTLDLSPLYNLTDQWTGSRMQPGYAPPPAPESRIAQMQQLGQQFGSLQQKHRQDEIDTLKSAIGQEQWKAGMDWKWADLKARERIASQVRAEKPRDIKQWEWDAAGYGQSMLGAQGTMRDLIAKHPGMLTSAEAKFKNGKFYPEGFKNPILKLFAQAQVEFINAILRRESGAAVSESEYVRYGQQFIPAWGDTGEVINQKFNSGNRKIRHLQLMSGRAWDMFGNETIERAEKEIGPNPNIEVGTVDNGYRFKGGDPAKEESWEKVGEQMGLKTKADLERSPYEAMGKIQ